MTAAAAPQRLPRATLIMAGAMTLFAVLATAAVRIAHVPPEASPEALRTARHIAPVASRDLRFADRADGAVVITDTSTGAIAQVIAPGEKTGFIRGVMRGLARDRQLRGIGEAPPFRLTAWRDGELSLTDTATGRAIELTAFGLTNRASFAALLGPEKAS